MSIRLQLADQIEASPVTVGDRSLTNPEKAMIVTSMRAVASTSGAETSQTVATHAGRLNACTKWTQFARFYGSDEKAWDAIQSVAASALRQADGG